MYAQCVCVCVCVYACCVVQKTMSSDDIGRTHHVVQYVLYESDFVEVTYADGIHIQLSPCGTTFICHEPLSADSQHPVNGIIIMKNVVTCTIYDVDFLD